MEVALIPGGPSMERFSLFHTALVELAQRPRCAIVVEFLMPAGEIDQDRLIGAFIVVTALLGRSPRLAETLFEQVGKLIAIDHGVAVGKSHGQAV